MGSEQARLRDGDQAGGWREGLTLVRGSAFPGQAVGPGWRAGGRCRAAGARPRGEAAAAPATLPAAATGASRGHCRHAAGDAGSSPSAGRTPRKLLRLRCSLPSTGLILALSFLPEAPQVSGPQTRYRHTPGSCPHRTRHPLAPGTWLSRADSPGLPPRLSEKTREPPAPAPRGGCPLSAATADHARHSPGPCRGPHAAAPRASGTGQGRAPGTTAATGVSWARSGVCRARSQETRRLDDQAFGGWERLHPGERLHGAWSTWGLQHGTRRACHRPLCGREAAGVRPREPR